MEFIAITPTPLDIERKEMRQNSQKQFGMLKIMNMSLKSIALLLIEPLLTNPGSQCCKLCLTKILAILLYKIKAIVLDWP